MLETTSKNQNVNYDTLRKKKHYTTSEACTTTDESELFDTLII